MIRNEKGFTIVETIASFVLVMTLSLSMLSILLKYKDTAQVENLKNTFQTLKETVTKDIQTDVRNRGLLNIERSGSNAVTFRFQDGTSTIFSVTNNVSSLDADTIRDKHYTYNNINYHIPSGVPDELPAGALAKDYQSVNIDLSDFYRVYDIGTYTIYSVNVNLTYDDLEEDYGIHLTFLVNDEAGLVAVTRNMMQDSSFENEPIQVRNSSTVITMGPIIATGQFVSNVTPFDGEKAVYFTCGTGMCDLLLDREIPVTPGRTYTISFYYATGSNVTGGVTQFEDSNGNVISGFTITNTGESWMRASTTWTAPEGVTAIYPGFGIQTSGTSWMAIDAVQVEEGEAVTLYHRT
ncbi:MAG: hypothetical protein SOZ06_00625 [Candidatus Faecenecus gallistercoris]|nr:hypothetical protein [Bacillota bacterium]MDY4050467.1 hypothetical protein [Candidatus Faecenecus gallistercoris]